MLSPFAEQLRDYLRAGYPALAVLTHEEERLLGDLRTLRTIGWSFVAWSIARGWVDADGRALNQGQRDSIVRQARYALDSLSHPLPDGSRFVLEATVPEVEAQLRRGQARFEAAWTNVSGLW